MSSSSKEPQTPDDHQMPFLSHLIELRDRLLKAVLTILIIFLCLFYFANDLYTLLADPLLKHLPEGANMVAIDVASPFIAPLKLTFILSIYLAMPVLFYHIWGFVAPGLYDNEKEIVFPLLASSTVLFYLGMLFAYFAVFPLVFGFFISVLPQGVEMSTDISRYLDFVLKMFFAFGLAFEVPVLTVLLLWTGMVSPQSLAEKRPYIIVGSFVIAMLLTPPDMFSQILLGVPMWLLFELGLWMGTLMLKRKSNNKEESIMPNSKQEGAPLHEGFASDYQPMTEAEMDEIMALDEDDNEATKPSKPSTDKPKSS